MLKKKLSEVCLGITDGSHNPPDGIEISEYPMISSKNIYDDKITLDAPRYLSRDDFVLEDRRTQIKPGDVLLTIVGTIGRSAVVDEAIGRITLQRSVAVLHVNHDICSSKYLMYLLQSKRRYLEQEARGVAQKGIYLKQLSNMEVSITDKSNQSTIVKVLDEVNGFIKLVQEQLKTYDDLIKSRFVEMFGDPILNSKGWDMATIGDIVTEIKYGTSRPAVEGGKYPYLRMNNLTYDGYLDLTDIKRIDIPDDELEKCIVRKGDILFNRTNSVELVGKTCVFNELEDMIIAGYIIRMRLKQCMLPLVFSGYMNTDALKKKLRAMAKGAVNQANINAQELQAIKIYLPPLNLQYQFASFVQQVDELKAEEQKNLEKAQLLFDSLMQQYFG